MNILTFNKMRERFQAYAASQSEGHLEVADLMVEVQASYLKIYGEQYAETTMFHVRELRIAVHNMKAVIWAVIASK